MIADMIENRSGMLALNQSIFVAGLVTVVA